MFLPALRARVLGRRATRSCSGVSGHWYKNNPLWYFFAAVCLPEETYGREKWKHIFNIAYNNGTICIYKSIICTCVLTKNPLFRLEIEKKLSIFLPTFSVQIAKIISKTLHRLHKNPLFVRVFVTLERLISLFANLCITWNSFNEPFKDIKYARIHCAEHIFFSLTAL